MTHPPLTADLIGQLVRSCFVASPGRTLGVVDLAQIEARTLLWLAGDEQNLATFTSGDPYVAFAAKMWGCSLDAVSKVMRQVAKVAVLGAGFGAGPDALGRVAKKAGVDLAASGTSGVGLVEGWRRQHPMIAGREVGRTFVDAAGRERQARRGGYWRRTETAARRALLEGDVGAVGAEGREVTWQRDGVDLLATLPSGRALRYRNAGVDPEQNLCYVDAKRGLIRTYGGRLTENVVQAVARDVVAHALPRLEEAGYPVVLHVHDEVVCELPLTEPELHLARVQRIMETPPAWAAGLPIKTEGHHGRRYGK